jgi:hypothetical protein
MDHARLPTWEWRDLVRPSLVCRAGFAGRGTAVARATERSMLASVPDPRCISGRIYVAGFSAVSRPSARRTTRIWIAKVSQ